MKIYEIEYNLYSRLFDEHENSDYNKTPSYLWGRFLVKNKNGVGYFCVDNTTNEWWEEEFKEKQQCLMWLVDDELTVEDVIERYNKNKDKYKDYEKYLVSQDVFCEENNIYHRDYFNFDPNKEYDFSVNLGSGTREFSATIENALGLASNYESDLSHKNTIIFSPLGFDWDENYRLVEQYLGKDHIKKKLKNEDMYDGFGLPYRRPDDSSLIHFKDEKNIRM
mgnify:CR=1 FL=1